MSDEVLLEPMFNALLRESVLGTVALEVELELELEARRAERRVELKT